MTAWAVSPRVLPSARTQNEGVSAAQGIDARVLPESARGSVTVPACVRERVRTRVGIGEENSRRGRTLSSSPSSVPIDRVLPGSYSAQNGRTEVGPDQRRYRLHVLNLLDAGLYPFPVHPRTKAPLAEWGDVDRLGYRPGVGEAIAQTYGYHALVLEWWTTWPQAGAAILTGLSRLLVLDVDVQHGGGPSWRQLVTDHPLPRTRVDRSRSGGLHVYYRTTTLAPSRLLPGYPGIEVKSARGMVMAPPSPGYVLAPGSLVHPAAVPGWLLTLAGRSADRTYHSSGTGGYHHPATQAALTLAISAITDAAGGGRHGELFRQACRAFRVCDDDRIETALIRAGQQTLPVSRWREVERTVRDARAKTKSGRHG